MGGLLMLVGAVGATAAPAAAATSAGKPAVHSTDAREENKDDWFSSGLFDDKRGQFHTVTIPGEDRFTPFALTIHVGDSVTWRNEDTDDHTVVTDDAFTNTDHRGVNVLIPGTDANHGLVSHFTLTFRKAGTFVYYCRFHSHLDEFNQPVAPGPRGGIQDPNGNFGTPMMGVVTVLPKKGLFSN
jgi:plastocyanin